MRLTFTTLVTSILLQIGLILPTQAGRAIFNQKPDQITSLFGSPQEQLVGWNVLVYTYQTSDLKALFPDFPRLKFSVIFQDNKLTSITLLFDQNDFTETLYEKGYNYDKVVAQKFFNYLFGYQSTTWQELSRTFINETIYDYKYCLGDGVANSFSRLGIAQMTDYVVWHYDSQCE